MDVLVLVKRTAYRALVEERKDRHVLGLQAKGDPIVRRMRRSHDAHQETVEEVSESLTALGVTFELVAGPRTNVKTAGRPLVVTVGGDGTLLAASHQLGAGVPLLGVNSVPDSSVGFFCAARKGTVADTLARALDGRLRPVVLARMRVDLDGACLHHRVLNEALFCHASPAATSRYRLSTHDAAGKLREEDQRSSGLWIGPSAGSTAAMRSAGGRVLPLSSTKIQFVVREPYVRLGQRLRMPRGLVSDDGRIEVYNKTNDARLFLDGHDNMHQPGLGAVITLRRSEEDLTVLGLRRTARTAPAGAP